MGNEFAQGREWNYEESLDWFLLDENIGGGWHKGVLKLVKDLNQIYQKIDRSLSSTTPRRVSIGLSLMMRQILCSPLNVAVQTENVLLSSVILPLCLAIITVLG